MCYMFYMALNGICLRCSVNRIVSSTRKKNNKKTDATLAHKIQHTTHGRIELDTHVDTTVLGSNCIVLSYTGKECEVSPYSPDYEAVRNIPVVTCATVWTNPQDGMAVSLVFHSGWRTSWTTLWSTQTNFEHMAWMYRITHSCRHHLLFQTKIMLSHFIPKGPLFVGTLGP